ncbi:NADH-quinone oxidoreductase subunit NuoG [candidate division GN15 bacterium]|nr:NADH-quinone oxidoreductase subunit NuoG [candidate division GN15 bacterium]
MATETKKDTRTAQQAPTVTLTIDGQEVTVPKGTTVLEAALGMGIHVPTFCWHPKLKSVGACRMCYVEIEKMPKLAVSCATEAMDGMVVHTDSDLVKRGRKAVIEFILANHPLDCPTCDKGGECDLQDLTFKHGFDDSRYDFLKMRFTEGAVHTTFDDVRIGPEIILNRNRCILCYKCVRANKEAFGEYDLGAFERGNITEINAAPGREVSNPFSGNLVEICPVGALTNTDWRYKIRVWLTKQARSICPFTSSGTNTLLWKEDHQQKIFRCTSRRNDDIDDGWIADVTRYGWSYVMAEDRLQTPLVKKEGKQVPVSWEEAIDLVARRLTEIDDTKGNVCIGGLINPQLDNESLHAFNKFMRVTIGANNVDHRLDYPMLPAQGDTAYSILSSQPFSIADIDTSDVIVSFGSDMLKEHPNEYLRMRKAYMFRQAKVFTINPYAVKNADIASVDVVYAPGTDEIVVNAICLAAIEEKLVDAGRAAGLKDKIVPNSAAEAAETAGVELDDIKIIARSLADGKQVTFLVGELVARCAEREPIAAAIANLNRLFGLTDKGQVARLARYANSKGAEKLGLTPFPAPEVKAKLERIFGGWPENEALTTDKMLVQMNKEAINAGLVVGANPLLLYPDREFARECLERLDFLVVCDSFETETTAIADVVLPLASWAEYAGDYVNLEGRTQHAEAAIKPRFHSRPALEIIEQLARAMDKPLFESADERRREVAEVLAAQAVLPWPNDYFEVSFDNAAADSEYTIPVFVGDDPHHAGHLTEKSPSLSNFVSEAYVEMSIELAAKLDVKAGDSVRVESEAGKVIVPVKVSDYLDTDAVFLPRNFSSAQVNSLLMRKKRVNRVKITRVAD